MELNKPLVNRVANSGIEIINLEDYYPQSKFLDFDLKHYLFKELILKEKDFRSALKEIDWNDYKDAVVLIYNSNDAIIPVWAYMLVAAYLSGEAADIFLGNQDEYIKSHFKKIIQEMDVKQYEEKRVVIKGCSNKPVPPLAYALITDALKPYAQSIMYGEPCSTVPIFKRPRKI